MSFEDYVKNIPRRWKDLSGVVKAVVVSDKLHKIRGGLDYM